MKTFQCSEDFAKELDANDPLSSFREQFFFPKTKSGEPFIYLTGNSLGLQPKRTREYVTQELNDWATLGVEGHLAAKNPWYSYHELLTEPTARLVGAKPAEVVVMNSLTVNLHLLMVSFYRPTGKRFKILIEAGAFPSDIYAVHSQVKLQGLEPEEAVLMVSPKPGSRTLDPDDLYEVIEKEGDSISLILLGNVNYLTGQAFDMREISKRAHAKGITVGIDLAHGVGNLNLNLHDDGVDFAVWCSYKYLNAGPGAIAGCFVHERHGNKPKLPRFAGWWGHDKKSRFQMSPRFEMMPGAEGWQLSNPPILQLAALRASMEIFDAAEKDRLWKKTQTITGFLEFVLQQTGPKGISMITPSEPSQRACQLSMSVGKNSRSLQLKLLESGVICDFREPDVLRVAPAPLYTKYLDVFRFVKILSDVMAR